LVLLGIVVAGASAAGAAESLRLAGTTCETPPVMHCPDTGCLGEVVTNGGPVVEPKTGRNYFLDYPCDLQPGEKVTFVLSLHGGGSYGNWQRHYFPILDYKDKHRLVIATPYSPRRVWGEEDDEYLQNIVTTVIDAVGNENIKAFWLAGHSQGGMTSRRVVCTDFFKDKIDGFLSLSGGRIGGSPSRGESFGIPRQRTQAASESGADAPTPPPRPRMTFEEPTCDFSHIYTTGEHEIGELPSTSEWADKYSCEAREQRADIVDEKPGYVYDSTRQDPGTKGWGLLPGPGRAEVFVYDGCKSGRVVADVVRIDKGHTEGLEPHVTEELVRLMLSASGGKLQGD
jgi:hypothetical protein